MTIFDHGIARETPQPFRAPQAVRRVAEVLGVSNDNHRWLRSAAQAHAYCRLTPSAPSNRLRPMQLRTLAQ